MSRTRDFIQQELINLIADKQRNGIDLPELSNDRMLAIVDSIVFDYTTRTHQETSLPEMIEWNLNQNLLHA